MFRTTRSNLYHASNAAFEYVSCFERRVRMCIMFRTPRSGMYLVSNAPFATHCPQRYDLRHQFCFRRAKHREAERMLTTRHSFDVRSVRTNSRSCSLGALEAWRRKEKRDNDRRAVEASPWRSWISWRHPTSTRPTMPDIHAARWTRGVARARRRC